MRYTITEDTHASEVPILEMGNALNRLHEVIGEALYVLDHDPISPGLTDAMLAVKQQANEFLLHDADVLLEDRTVDGLGFSIRVVWSLMPEPIVRNARLTVQYIEDQRVLASVSNSVTQAQYIAQKEVYEQAAVGALV